MASHFLTTPLKAKKQSSDSLKSQGEDGGTLFQSTVLHLVKLAINHKVGLKKISCKASKNLHPMQPFSGSYCQL